MIEMTDKLLQCIKDAKDVAIRHQDIYVRMEHIVYTILCSENIISSIVQDELVDIQFLLEDIDSHNKDISVKSDDISKNRNVKVDPIATASVSKVSKSFRVMDIEHLFLSIYDKDTVIVQILNKYGITKSLVEKNLTNSLEPTGSNSSKSKSDNPSMTSKKQSKTPALDLYGIDFTALAALNKIEPVIGRDVEVERITQILSRKTKRNAILIGAPGTGKCITNKTNITLRNDLTGEVLSISVEDYMNTLPDPSITY